MVALGIPLLLTGTVGAIGFGVWLAVHRRERRERRAALAHAARLGYVMDVDTKAPPDLGFRLFSAGSRRKVTYHTWREGSSDSVFQFEYTTGSGDSRRVHEHTAVLVAVPFVAPRLEIGPEGFWSSLGRIVGIRDVEVESPEFNERYRVSCDDERFAITLLDHRMIAWLLSPASGAGLLRFELLGPWMLCWGDRIDYVHAIPLLEWAQRSREVLPSVLTSLYPVAR